ncbi:MAG: phosphatase PAP2 family protein [Cyclobacteriaceae bacterium]|nr:phosphatase PAP2 family protein [Cyclobacteriaceae bacterium]
MLILALIIPHGKDVLLINGYHHAMLDRISPVITELGNAVYYLPVLLVLLFVRFRWATALSLAGILHGLAVVLSKRLLFPDALRPTGMLDKASLHFIPGIKVHTLMSFPSGHTATAFAFLLILSLYLNNRWLSILLLTIALLTGLSRIYLLQHFLIDVAAGATIGTASAWTACYLINQQPWSWLDWRLTFSVRKANEIQGSITAQG